MALACGSGSCCRRLCTISRPAAATSAGLSPLLLLRHNSSDKITARASAAALQQRRTARTVACVCSLRVNGAVAGLAPGGHDARGAGASAMVDPGRQGLDTISITA
eukprot:6210726-Pleurochrysis_carterae.AAC.2